MGGGHQFDFGNRADQEERGGAFQLERADRHVPCLAVDLQRPGLHHFVIRALNQRRQLCKDGSAKIGERCQNRPAIGSGRQADHLCIVLMSQDLARAVDQYRVRSRRHFLFRHGLVERCQKDVRADYGARRTGPVGEGRPDLLVRVKEIGRGLDLPGGRHCRLVPVPRSWIVAGRIIRAIVAAQGGQGRIQEDEAAARRSPFMIDALHDIGGLLRRVVVLALVAIPDSSDQKEVAIAVSDIQGREFGGIAQGFADEAEILKPLIQRFGPGDFVHAHQPGCHFGRTDEVGEFAQSLASDARAHRVGRRSENVATDRIAEAANQAADNQ